MFPPRYFAPAYFAPAYFAEVGAAATEGPAPARLLVLRDDGRSLALAADTRLIVLE